MTAQLLAQADARLRESEPLPSIITPAGLMREEECANPFERNVPPWHFRRDVYISRQGDKVALGINVTGGAPISCLAGEWITLSADEAEHVGGLLSAEAIVCALPATYRSRLAAMAKAAGARPRDLALSLLMAVIDDDASTHSVAS